jgi:hypothetical protein
MSSQLRIENLAQLPFGIVFDITERKQAQDALRETRTELARVARMNQMVAMTGQSPTKSINPFPQFWQMPMQASAG